MRFEVSYQISGAGRTFLYFFGLFGLFESLEKWFSLNKSPGTYRKLKWRIGYHEIKKAP